jgi:hypothetical protein
MKGKEKCEFLKAFRMKIAEDNGISYTTEECHHDGDCTGTCPMCDRESSILLEELRKKDKIILKNDGKLCLDDGELDFEQFSRLLDDMESSVLEDHEQIEYLGDIAPESDDHYPPSPYDESSITAGVIYPDRDDETESDPNDGWD